MATVEVVCYKYKPLKNGELPIKIKVCKDRKTRYINLGVSTRQEFWDFGYIFPFQVLCGFDLLNED